VSRPSRRRRRKPLCAQSGRRIDYHAFCERIAAGGCVGYFVSLAGRRALYYGRTGDTYIEPFPAANWANIRGRRDVVRLPKA
jgi:uncharacterized protein YbcV (DUF1398 family)